MCLNEGTPNQTAWECQGRVDNWSRQATGIRIACLYGGTSKAQQFLGSTWNEITCRLVSWILQVGQLSRFETCCKPCRWTSHFWVVSCSFRVYMQWFEIYIVPTSWLEVPRKFDIGETWGERLKVNLVKFWSGSSVKLCHPQIDDIVWFLLWLFGSNRLTLVL